MIELALSQASKQAQIQLAIESLLDAWKRFVIQVENGYAESYYEYTNDLSTRDILDDLLHVSDSSIQAKLLRFLEPWDSRFYQATRESDLIVPQDRNSHRDWWHRVPKILIDELRSDLGL